MFMLKGHNIAPKKTFQALSPCLPPWNSTDHISHLCLEQIFRLETSNETVSVLGTPYQGSGQASLSFQT